MKRITEDIMNAFHNGLFECKTTKHVYLSSRTIRNIKFLQGEGVYVPYLRKQNKGQPQSVLNNKRNRHTIKQLSRIFGKVVCWSYTSLVVHSNVITKLQHQLPLQALWSKIAVVTASLVYRSLVLECGHTQSLYNPILHNL